MSRNRYIVECKGKRKGTLLQHNLVEIDTLWNVKANGNVQITIGTG